jgi:hypothetical protein
MFYVRIFRDINTCKYIRIHTYMNIRIYMCIHTKLKRIIKQSYRFLLITYLRILLVLEFDGGQGVYEGWDGVDEGEDGILDNL